MSVLCVCDQETALPSEVHCGSGDETEMLGAHLLIQQLCAGTCTELTHLSKLEIFPSPCLEILNRWRSATDGRMLTTPGFGSICTGDKSFLIISTYPERLSGEGACSDRSKHQGSVENSPYGRILNQEIYGHLPLCFSKRPTNHQTLEECLGENSACLRFQRNFVFSLAPSDR